MVITVNFKKANTRTDASQVQANLLDGSTVLPTELTFETLILKKRRAPGMYSWAEDKILWWKINNQKIKALEFEPDIEIRKL